MRPHPRIRKTVKWGGAVICVLLFEAWHWSASMHTAWYRSRSTWSLWHYAINDGRVEFGVVELPQSMGSPFKALLSINLREPPGLKCRFRWRNDSTYTGIAIPLWFPVVVAMAPTITAWRLDTLARRRARIGLCPKCGYNRIGLSPQTVCPECGAAALVPPPAAS